MIKKRTKSLLHNWRKILQCNVFLLFTYPAKKSVEIYVKMLC